MKVVLLHLSQFFQLTPGVKIAVKNRDGSSSIKGCHT